MARWTTPDKLSEHPDQIDKSPYAYVWDDPIGKNDPDGNCPSCIIEAALALAGGEEVGTAGFGTPAAAATIIVGGVAALGNLIYEHFQSRSTQIQDTHVVQSNSQSTPEKEKSPPNPNGAKGNADHQEKVGQLADKARAEAKPGEKVITEKKIQVPGSNRRPDVQVVDENGKTVKVHEAERKPNSARNKQREAEYDKLKVDHQTHPVGNN